MFSYWFLRECFSKYGQAKGITQIDSDYQTAPALAAPISGNQFFGLKLRFSDQISETLVYLLKFL